MIGQTRPASVRLVAHTDGECSEVDIRPVRLALYVCKEFEQSIATAELALTMSGRHSWAMATLAVIFADCGRVEDADAVYAELAARARRQYVPPSMLAAAASGASRENEAICHVREALRIHDPACVFFSKYWLLAVRLHAYPRFRELLSEMGFE